MGAGMYQNQGIKNQVGSIGHKIAERKRIKNASPAFGKPLLIIFL